jgi:voltage-gated potassium channel
MPRRREPPRELDTFAPRVRSRSELVPFLRRLGWVALALVVLLAYGSVAYVVTEGVSLWDGFLWSLDTIATEGARNQPDTVGGEIVWVSLIVLGVGTLLYALVTVVEVLVSGHLRTLLDERREQQAIDALTGHVIICGFGRVGRQVARDLRAAGARYVVIDARPRNAEEARHVGVRFVQGSAADDEVLVQAGIDRARAVIACVDDDAENVFIALSARQLNGEVTIIARASNPDTEPKLLRAGATRVVSPYRTSGSEMARVAITPQVSGELSVAPEFKLEEITVEPGSGADGSRIVDVRGDAIIVAVRRVDGTFLTQPPGSTGLRAGDVIVALGATQTMARLEGAFSPHGQPART